MANVQKQFNEFNARIKLKRFEENQTLRDKRDIIRRKLDERLPGVFEEAGEECPKYDYRDQGSYKMGTGIVPLDGDFDIDQGLYFEVSTEDYPDPVVLKRRVHSALDGHTRKVVIRRSCVTVFYQKDNEDCYHVDIAVYSDGSKNADGKSRVAKGKENSGDEFRTWELSDPQALEDKLTSKFDDENDRAQFRHTIRYLKRWKDVNFETKGHAAPLGIGLTAAAYYYLQPQYSDAVAGTHNDLKALIHLVRSMLNQFAYTWDADEGKSVRRLIICLPVEPSNDLFELMTNSQMTAFEDKLKILLLALETAEREIDPVVACGILQGVFGEDFPVPPKEETAKRHAPAIVSSSNSA